MGMGKNGVGPHLDIIHNKAKLSYLWLPYFLKRCSLTLLFSKILFAFLTNFLKRQNFLLSCILFGSSRGSFSKKMCPKRTFPSDFVKLGSGILYLFLAEKMVVCFFVSLFVSLLQLSPILAYFFFNWSTHRVEKGALKEKIIWCTVWELLNP